MSNGVLLCVCVRERERARFVSTNQRCMGKGGGCGGHTELEGDERALGCCQGMPQEDARGHFGRKTQAFLDCRKSGVVKMFSSRSAAYHVAPALTRQNSLTRCSLGTYSGYCKVLAIKVVERDG
jgi:hypothetical protein